VPDRAGAARVTLIRHAEAGDDAPSDDTRALTARGRADARRVGRALARRGVRFSSMVSSPLVRAVQTAEIIAAAIAYRGRILCTPVLTPEADPRAVVALLGALGGERSVALVAHEPILSGVAAALIHEPRYAPLRKAEALRIRLPGGPGAKGVPRWRIDPQGRRERLS
jgi:phosphohistidine phosphatase